MQVSSPLNSGRLIAALFVVMSMAFGLAIILVNPPLRGPDEPAHFLRAYAIAGGAVLPAQTDRQGRRGTELPPRLHDAFAHYEEARWSFRDSVGLYRDVETAFRHRSLPTADGAPVFVVYSGSEGYTPVPYLPYLPGAIAGRLLGLGFEPLLTVMRISGLLITTALIGAAIWLSPGLGWALFAIGMLPAALYGRTIVSADGASLGLAILVTVLSLRAALGLSASLSQRAIWMALCVLTKPPQAAFVLLEAMAGPWRGPQRVRLLRRAGTFALVALPGVFASLAFVAAIDADAANWRVFDEGMDPREFDPVWRLGQLIADPMHFIRAACESLKHAAELGRQLVGVLGWLDVRLAPWAYAVLPLLTVLACAERLEAGAARTRIAVVALATAAAYGLAVLLIFYLTWTPTTGTQIDGLQGRYFLVGLPAFALGLAAVIGRGLPAAARATAALTAAMLSGAVTLEALYRVHW